jgi:hypothetical protein
MKIAIVLTFFDTCALSQPVATDLTRGVGGKRTTATIPQCSGLFSRCH